MGYIQNQKCRQKAIWELIVPEHKSCIDIHLILKTWVLLEKKSQFKHLDISVISPFCESEVAVCYINK